MKATPITLFLELIKTLPIAIFKVFLGNKARVMSHRENIDKIISGKSFVRWADGETAIARGKDIGYQRAEIELTVKLRAISKLNSEEIILGIPWPIRVPLWSDKWNLRLIKIHMSSRIFLARRVNRRKRSIDYGDTLIWYEFFKDLPKILGEISANKRTMLIASEPKFLNACPPETDFVQVLAKNAFSDYASISKKIDNWITSNKILGFESVIFLAAGPTSKAIALDFFRKTQCVDVGHGFNFNLANSQKYAWNND